MKYLNKVIGVIFIAALIASCEGDTSMLCKSDIHKKLSAMLADGKNIRQIVDNLNNFGIEYIDVKRDDFARYGDVAPNQPDLSGVILVSTEIEPSPAETDPSSVHTSELVKIGYGDDY